MVTATQTIEPKTTPPFSAGEFVEIRGWRGVLEPGVNPFGSSGFERRVVRDNLGIEYLHDPASDLVYASPRFSRESLDTAYQAPTSHIDTRQFESADADEWLDRNDRHAVMSRVKVDLVRGWLKPGARVIDVGCHVGLFVLLARRAGLDCVGIDVSETAIETGRQRLGLADLRACPLESAGFDPDSFDGVVIWDVLEHLHNLMEVMEHCAVVLKPGGCFFAQVPNHRGVSAVLKTLACRLGVRGRRYHHFGFPWHLYHFSPKSLRVLMQRVGLEPLIIRSFTHRTKDRGRVGGPGGWLNQSIEHLALADYLYVVARKTA